MPRSQMSCFSISARKSAPPLDITGLPGFEKLDAKEKEVKLGIIGYTLFLNWSTYLLLFRENGFFNFSCVRWFVSFLTLISNSSQFL